MNDQARHNVLIVSGDAETTRCLLEAMAARGTYGAVAATAAAAEAKAESAEWDLLVVDLETEAERIGRVLDNMRADRPELPVALVSPRRTVSEAVRAVKAGFDDVLVKPLERSAVDDLLDRLAPSHRVEMACEARQGSRRLYQIAGRSRRLLTAVAMARRIAPTTMPVLIGGESGTGKELLAYLVHHASSRAEGPYVRVNCAALSESLLESELFGHEKGAFTGAVGRRKGRFERAHGGSLLLDEISETGPRLQAELLRVLETQDFERVGGSESIRVNVRVISTTNRDLAEEVEAGRFRRDLYYRLAGVRIVAPPLRERPEDLPVLIWHFVNQFAPEAKRRITELDAGMLAEFAGFAWPGNVRQLRNIVRSAVLLGSGPVLSLAGIEPLWAEMKTERIAREETLRLRELEKQAIFEALRRTDRHYAKAAELLGITDRTLREKLRRYRQSEEEETVVRETA
jgi:two-component system response regulator HydG/two-component system response regulator AtoC